MLLNLDGWDLTHTGEGFEHYDAIGTSPKGTEVVIEFKFRNKYYKEKLLECYKYDKLIETGKIALYFVNDPKGNYMFWLNNLKDLKVQDMYCPDTTLWTKKKVLKPARKMLDLTNKGFSSGELNILSLVDANNTYFESQLTYLDLLYQARMELAEVKLYAGQLITDTQVQNASSNTASLNMEEK